MAKTSGKRLAGTERRMQILDTACRIFAYKGLHGTTTKEIAKAAGISEPILYQHFKNKEDIYHELELLCSHQTAYFKKAVEHLGDGIESLIVITYLLVRVVSFCKEPGTNTKPQDYGTSETLLRLQGYSFLSDGRFARLLVENCIGAIFEQWFACYKASFADKLLTVEKAEEMPLWMAYQLVIGAGFFVLPASRMVDKIKDADDGAKAATLFILRGLGVKESVLEKKIHWPTLRKFYQEAIAVAGA